MESNVTQFPHVIVEDNVTYCWNAELKSYTWCPSEAQLYNVPIGILLLLSSFYGMISIAAVVGNTLVIFVVATSKSMQNVTNLFIANLAFSDVIIAVFCIPFQFYAALLQRWDLPEFMCKFCPFMQILSVNVSIFTLVAISLDRYRAIITPLHEKMSKTTAKIIITFIWASSVLVALPTGFLFKFSYVYDDVNGGLKPFCSTEEMVVVDYPTPDLSIATYHNQTFSNATFMTSLAAGNLSSDFKLIRGDHKVKLRGNMIETEEEPPRRLGLFEIYGILLMVIEYALPLVIISIAYARMGTRLWLTRTPGTAQDKRDECILSNKKKVIKMLFVVVLIFCLCWLPWHLYHCLVLITPDINQYRYINIIFFASHWLAMSNSCYNPFVYAIYSEKFKREFKECTQCVCCNYIKLPGRHPSVPSSPWNQSGRGVVVHRPRGPGGCNRRGAHECAEGGQLLSTDNAANGDCIEMATLQEESELTRVNSTTIVRASVIM